MSHLSETLRRERERRKREAYWRRHPRFAHYWAKFSLYSPMFPAIGLTLVFLITSLYNSNLFDPKEAVTLWIVFGVLETLLFFLLRPNRNELKAIADAIREQSNTNRAILEYLKKRDGQDEQKKD